MVHSCSVGKRDDAQDAGFPGFGVRHLAPEENAGDRLYFRRSAATITPAHQCHSI